MIELGAKVRDKVTGFTGTAICRVEYMNGCLQYGVKGRAFKSKDGGQKMPSCHYIDEGQLVVVVAKKKDVKRKTEPGTRPGGPSSDAPPSDSPSDDGSWAPE